MAKNKGNERAMEMLQIITKEAMAVDNFCGVRFVAEYTITLYLIVAKKKAISHSFVRQRPKKAFL